MTFEQFVKVSGLGIQDAAFALYRARLAHLITEIDPDVLTILTHAAEVVETEHAMLLYHAFTRPEKTSALFDGGAMLQDKKKAAVAAAVKAGVARVMHE